MSPGISKSYKTVTSRSSDSSSGNCSRSRREWYVTYDWLINTLLNAADIVQARGEEVPTCFGKYLLERQRELDLSDGETAYLAGSMFGAGSDTTASAISVSVLAAACYPEAQRRVQEELDQVIGRNRGQIYFPWPLFQGIDTIPFS
jgi:cytochrome P450